MCPMCKKIYDGLKKEWRNHVLGFSYLAC
jgi:hypothetical protein